RDAAYEALLRSRRKELHSLVARTIAKEFTALRETHPEVLAHHWSEAGESEHAIAEWERAGNSAEVRGAFKEALDSYQRALAMLNLIPESPERDPRELRLRERAFLMLWMITGPSPDTIQALQRTMELAERSGNLASLVQLLHQAGMSALILSGDIRESRTLAD